jgi:cob(I)alamin adenosyltransferase
MVIIFTGNGKGKTTASLGQAVRTVGRGENVLMIQFIKGPWASGEDYVDILKKSNSSNSSESSPIFKSVKMGKGFVGILGDKLPKEEHAAAAREALEFFKSELKTKNPTFAKASASKWKLIILDEINVAVSLDLLKPSDVLDAVKDVPVEQFVIFTGRDAPKEFIDRADLVTEMKEIKHPFNDGTLAKAAMDF